MTATRTETNSLGTIEIPVDRYWGPQTERARRLFRIGQDRFLPGVIRAQGLQKWGAAEANRANELLGQPLGARRPVHPNDHVNRGQSSNDSFPTVMHLAAVEAVERDLRPGLGTLRASLEARAAAWAKHRQGGAHPHDGRGAGHARR